MKVKEKDLNSTEKSSDGVQKNGKIEKKKKKKENFEVRIPRIIVRNLNFKVCQILFIFSSLFDLYKNFFILR